MSNLRYVSLFELYVHTIIQADDLMSPLSEAVRFFAQTSVLCKAETGRKGVFRDFRTSGAFVRKKASSQRKRGGAQGDPSP